MSESNAPGPARPLAIGLLLGVSGWAAGLFMLVFVAALFEPDGAGQAAIAGTVLLAAAWGLFRVDRDGARIFVAQLALALSIAGQCFVLYALVRDNAGVASVSAAALLLQAVLAGVMPNRLSRVLSTLFATIAWALMLRFALFGEHGNWHPANRPDPVSLPAALAGWLATWLPLAAGLWWAVRNEPTWTARGRAPWVRPILTGLVAGLAWATLASQPFESDLWLGGGQTDAGGLALWPLLSALGALGALVAAFALRRRALVALCAVAALLHVGHFYWVLGCSLLAKSLVMLAMGGGLLAAAHVLRSRGKS